MAAVDKEINIKVNKRDLSEAVKSLKGMEEASKKILEVQESLLKVMNSIAKVNEKENKSHKEKISLLKEQLAIEKEIRAQYALKRELQGLEKPRMSFLEQTQKYKGASGAFTRWGERIQEEGAAKVSKYDEEIAVKQGQYAAMVKAKGSKWENTEEAKKQRQDIENLQKERSKTIGDTKTQANKYAAAAQAAGKLEKSLERVGKAALDLAMKPFKDLFEGVKKAVTAMLSFESGVATFSTSTSLITNTAAREQQLKYGLTESQNYAFTKAKEMLNIKSDEDLMYMNKEQRDRLLSYMENYSRWYEELDSSGVLQSIQEMQLEFNELKEELAMDFLSWVAENKENIMMAIKGIFEFVKFIAEKIMGFINAIGRFTGGRWGSGSYEMADLTAASDNINNTSNNVKNTNITINANTTNNATGVLGSQEALDQFNEDNWSRLAKQVVGVIGG